MRISNQLILEEQKLTGFRTEILEKVILLIELLETLMNQSFLKENLVLKGGTAINLFHLPLPRLSIDIDLNYIGSHEKVVMLEDRKKIEAILTGICKRLGFTIRRKPSEHAGGKMSLLYNGIFSQTAKLEVDLNYVARVPLWPTVKLDSCKLGSLQAKSIPTLDLHELFAGKLTALFARRAGRDLFDAYQLFKVANNLDNDRLRIAFIIYSAGSRLDLRKIDIKDISFTESELKNQLIPMLSQAALKEVTSVCDWANTLLSECKEAISKQLFPFTERETAFIDSLYNHAEVNPALLTDDEYTIERIQRNPGLQWKAFNIAKNRE